MIIDIKPTRDGGWCVIAHTTSGDCHDFFTTQAQALDFAQSFYGGKVKTAGQAPATTPEACLKYHTSEHSCACPDFVNHGGSYFDEFGTPACKHVFYKNNLLVSEAESRDSASKITGHSFWYIRKIVDTGKISPLGYTFYSVNGGQ